ncbi:helix-turn-helix domain-containing protein [Flavobacterium sp. XS2P24]|uniref:helix-turn-helix domain-containing protein n=1 Tax=Flavobacterium sp. XS2P24 TaxID=3041249 RepID=UPI0024A93583|nr:helix-turn-helix domain-containing protein [Flavobacterium sp. XS2P24]MDI6049399.1 helix-turn-helix domain-containing protein [Flavobacterium sp. XS2P24]
MENPFEIILEKLDNIEKAIEILNTSSNIDDDFMNIEQLSSFIGLSKPTIYRLTHKQKIPYFKASKRLYFKKSHIKKWIYASKVITKVELNQLSDEYIYRNPLY